MYLREYASAGNCTAASMNGSPSIGQKEARASLKAPLDGSNATGMVKGVCRPGCEANQSSNEAGPCVVVVVPLTAA